MQTLKYGSRGEDVRTLQRKLNIWSGRDVLTTDGVFGKSTEAKVIAFQKSVGLTPDGICGSRTWEMLNKLTEKPVIVPPTGLYVDDFLKKGQYVEDYYPKTLIVLHHTAGANNPFNCITNWNTYGSVGRVCTEFVVGGLNAKTGDATYDGKIVHAYPYPNAYGFHIGKCGVANNGLDKISVGIELCDFGHVVIGKDGIGRTYVNSIVQPQQILTLDAPFRGYTHYHRYSDAQLESLRRLLLFISERDNIDLHESLVSRIHKLGGAKAFDYWEDAYYGRIKNGIVTHANIRKDKEDVFPQPELIDMLISL